MSTHDRPPNALQPNTGPPSGLRLGEISRRLEVGVRSSVESVAALVRFVRAYLASRMAPALGEERGEIASWVVVTALVVVAAIAIVGIVVSKLTTSANNIQTP